MGGILDYRSPPIEQLKRGPRPLSIPSPVTSALVNRVEHAQPGAVMDRFEIFMGRMLLCRRAAEKLGVQFKLMLNEQQLIARTHRRQL